MHLVIFLSVIFLWTDCIESQCTVPTQYHGDFFSLDSVRDGVETTTLINDQGIQTKNLADGRCVELRPYPKSYDAEGNFDSLILFRDQVAGCFQCWQIFYRTANVLQYKLTTCQSPSTSETPTLDSVCSEILPTSELNTFFRRKLVNVNCKQTLEGVYHFTYEVNQGGGSKCNSPYSLIQACQVPGSPYVDNQVFDMTRGKCPEVASSVSDKTRYQCMGSWRDNQGNIYSAVADLNEDQEREKFRCMLTRDDQQLPDNIRRWSMSRFAQCSTVKTPYDGDIMLELVPVIIGSQLVQPTCNLPRNFTGTWFHQGEFDTDVVINSTHIYFKTKIDQFSFREVYFTCQQHRDTRYLMKAVTVGKCEVDYVCFDFLPRHQNIIRWRMGRPFRHDPRQENQPGFLTRKFRQACTWWSFTMDRNDVAWKYNTFLLNPPAPVDCPIGGRYTFKQTGDQAEFYYTRIRGITARPRHQIGCLQQVTEFKSCSNNPKKIFIEAEYCETLDHTGRPIGEYDEPDRELTCSGFWMEDMRSYLITYDEEDAVSKFRCWVYERLDWRDIVISRATRGICGATQTATSYLSKNGASLALALRENERIFDNCPQRYNDGRDPYKTQAEIFVFGSAEKCLSNTLVLLTVVLLYFTIFR